MLLRCTNQKNNERLAVNSPLAEATKNDWQRNANRESV